MCFPASCSAVRGSVARRKRRYEDTLSTAFISPVRKNPFEGQKGKIHHVIRLVWWILRPARYLLLFSAYPKTPFGVSTGCESAWLRCPKSPYRRGYGDLGRLAKRFLARPTHQSGFPDRHCLAQCISAERMEFQSNRSHSCEIISETVRFESLYVYRFSQMRK